jgi:hypothetical protein
MNGPRGSILLADDEEKILKRLGRACARRGTTSSRRRTPVTRSGS